MNSTSMNRERVLVALSFGPLAVAVALQLRASSTGSVVLLVLGFALLAAGIRPSWRRAAQRAAERGEGRDRRSYAQLPWHLKIPLTVVAVLAALFVLGALALLVAVLVADVSPSLALVVGTVALVQVVVTFFLWRVSTRPSGARQELERQMQERSDTRRQVVSAVGGLAILVVAGLVTLLLLDTGRLLALVAGSVLGMALGVAVQVLDVRETRRVVDASGSVADGQANGSSSPSS